MVVKLRAGWFTVHFTVHFTYLAASPTLRTMSDTANPLVAPFAAEVPLPAAPLVRVIAQLRFPEVLSVEQREFVAPFQAAIRSVYPVLREEQVNRLLFGSEGVTTAKPQIVWRFSDTPGHWRVSLSSTFLALETTKYVSPRDLLSRLGVLLEALQKFVEPAQVDRLGIRYVDRVEGADVEDIARLVRPEVRGTAGTPAAMNVVHSLSESVFALPDDHLVARWGVLPPNTSFDPGIEPSAAKSWILDLDMFSLTPMPFNVSGVIERAESFAARIYTVFRWAVTDDFLKRFGGRP